MISTEVLDRARTSVHRPAGAWAPASHTRDADALPLSTRQGIGARWRNPTAPPRRAARRPCGYRRWKLRRHARRRRNPGGPSRFSITVRRSTRLLLEHHADVAARAPRRGAGHRRDLRRRTNFAADVDQPVDAPDQRALSRARRPNDRCDPCAAISMLMPVRTGLPAT